MQSLGLLLISALALASGCASAPSAPRPLVRVDGACAGAHTIDAEGNPSGSARPVGDLARYRVPLFISERRVRVRADASWPGEDHRNVIGTLEGRRWVLGEGPLENAEYGAGIGYAVPLEDRHGRRCRGYLSATVVRAGDA